MGWNITIPIVLFFFLTIGNYSFFRYSISGTDGVPLVLRVIPYLRLLLPAWVIFFAFRFNYFFTVKIIKEHIDVLLLATSWLFSSVLSFDISSYLLYGTWTFISLISVLLFVCYTALIYRKLEKYLHSILEVIFFGNSIIILLGFLSILVRRPGQGSYNLLFTSNTFWAYPVMIAGVVSLIFLGFFNYKLRYKFLYFLVLIVSLYLVYYSARRSTLFVLLFSAGLILVPLRTPQIIAILVALLLIALVGASVDTREVLDSLPESNMKYRLERMFGYVKGAKESSYEDRQKIWDIYMESFYDNPVFGAGLAANERLADKFPQRLKGYSAHNTFIGLIAETGLMGALLLMVVIVRSLLHLLRVTNRKWIQIYIILFVPTLLINWVEYNLIPGQIFFLYTVVIWLLPRGVSYLSHPPSSPTPQ